MDAGSRTEPRRRGILADDMGLGKTYQVVALIRGNPVQLQRGTLIVTMVSTVSQWKEVMSDFGRLKPFVVMAGHKCPVIPTTDVVLTTYSVFQRPVVPSCLKREWQRIILDEGHVIRTPSSRLYKELTNLIRHRQYRWILSGTHVQNDESELETLLTWVGCKQGAAERSKFIIRRTLPFVMEKYPDSFYMPRYSTKIKYLFFKYPEERRLYFKVNPVKSLRDVSEAIVANNKSIFLQTILKQRQLCVHPKLLINAEGRNYLLRLMSTYGVVDDYAAYDSDDDFENDEMNLCVTDATYDEFMLKGHSEHVCLHCKSNSCSRPACWIRRISDPVHIRVHFAKDQ
jgi:hypothetical protein